MSDASASKGESAEFVTKLSELEECWLEPTEASVEELRALLERRQSIIDGLVKLSRACPVGPSLKKRIHDVVARDRTLANELRARQSQIKQQFARAADGRAAARGYRSGNRIRPAFNRVA